MENPCEDCILLPVCISRYYKYRTSMFGIYALTYKCSMINDFLIDRELTEKLSLYILNSDRSATTKEFFNKFKDKKEPDEFSL